MKITHAKPLPGYRLELQFSNGESGIVDLSSLAGRGVFAAWVESGVFERVAATPFGSVEWPGEIDLCPDALYLRMKGIATDMGAELDAIEWDVQYARDVADGRLDEFAEQAIEDLRQGRCTDL